MSDPVGSDITIPLSPEGVPDKSRTTMTPSPEGMVVPASEKPSAVVALADTINPESPAAPPDAEFIVASSTLN